MRIFSLFVLIASIVNPLVVQALPQEPYVKLPGPIRHMMWQPRPNVGTTRLDGLASSSLGVPSGGPITHVVIVFQENRTPDQLLQDASCTSPDANPSECLSGFSFSSVGMVGKHQVALSSLDLCSNTPCHCHVTCSNPQAYDVNHEHSAWVNEYNSGAMNGWDHASISGSGCQISHCALTYTPAAQVEPYVNLAVNYATDDNFFEDNQGPSYVAHMYWLAGTSACNKLCLTTGAGVVQGHPTPPPTNTALSAYKIIDNPQGAGSGNGCDGSNNQLLDAIDPYGNIYDDYLYGCIWDTTLVDELLTAGDTAQYYQAGPSGSAPNTGLAIWRGPESFWNLWNSSTEYNTLVDTNPTDFVNNVCTNHTLASVTWITPTNLSSDHANQSDGSGPDWIASIVNAIGYNGTVTTPASADLNGNAHSYSCNGAFWNSTAIFIMWDDWGGWYDHVAPYLFNDYEKGFRVPLLVVSPYIPANSVVDHTFASVGSVLLFCEEAFNLPSLGGTDVGADDLSEMFNFSQSPRTFTQVTMRAPRYVAHVNPWVNLHEPPDY